MFETAGVVKKMNNRRINIRRAEILAINIHNFNTLDAEDKN